MAPVLFFSQRHVALQRAIRGHQNHLGAAPDFDGLVERLVDQRGTEDLVMATSIGW